ncbi:Lar family restriction alleviation protein [uncultured Deefgea sp.]|uniref:Lar family restriction alleviation protein n=1 Tax=uncultured Deefgea sp. TaxID=1304914 RepID=UPI0026343451|nr:Lar family restriction alleviation protein [uncultured Deefgea sp.]
MITTTSTDQTGRPTPKPCPKCGAIAEQHKAGSNRFWVQCSKLGKNGNCSGIGQQGSNKKEAIANWNSLR